MEDEPACSLGACSITEQLCAAHALHTSARGARHMGTRAIFCVQDMVFEVRE